MHVAGVSQIEESVRLALAGSGDVELSLQPYGFFPMLHIDNRDTFLGMHQTDGADPDLPRIALHNQLVTVRNYDFDYRYVAA